MGARFIGVDREQVFVMPPSVRDSVPEGHLGVDGADLSAFYAAYRSDGHGRLAYEPGMMVALLMYAYARGNRSAGGIERACIEDVAYRVVAATWCPITRRSPSLAVGTSRRWARCSRACSGCHSPEIGGDSELAEPVQTEIRAACLKLGRPLAAPGLRA
jgi:hypothetical protein